MKIYVGSDRIGFELKGQIVKTFINKGYNVIDIGPLVYKSVHYPQIALEVSQYVNDNAGSLGILICSTGIGISIVANKVKNIRAANCTNLFTAEHARLHNDANILCLGANVVEAEIAQNIVDIFLTTSFEGGKHVERLKMIEKLDENK